jgi:hypothetical protein
VPVLDSSAEPSGIPAADGFAGSKMCEHRAATPWSRDGDASAHDSACYCRRAAPHPSFRRSRRARSRCALLGLATIAPLLRPPLGPPDAPAWDALLSLSKPALSQSSCACTLCSSQCMRKRGVHACMHATHLYSGAAACISCMPAGVPSVLTSRLVFEFLLERHAASAEYGTRAAAAANATSRGAAARDLWF